MGKYAGEAAQALPVLESMANSSEHTPAGAMCPSPRNPLLGPCHNTALKHCMSQGSLESQNFSHLGQTSWANMLAGWKMGMGSQLKARMEIAEFQNSEDDE